MEGGVVTIRFEADTTDIGASLQEIEKRVKNINTKGIANDLKIFNAETRRINATARQASVMLKEHQQRVKDLRQHSQKINQQTTSLVKTIYMANAGLRLMKDGCNDIGKSIKSTIGFVGKLSTALYKAFNPIETIGMKFLGSSGLLSKAKNLLSFNSLSNLGKSSIEAASDLTEVQNIVETAFPNMINQMQEWADNSIQAFGLSEKSAKEYASTLGLMAQSAGIAEKASYKLGTSLTAVTADLASIYNMDQRAVYEKIRSGVIGGRTMAIAQLGINMSQANLQAYMESKGMSQKYNSLDNATKTAIRYNYVLEQTRKIQGDFVKTQGTWANQTRMLAENWTQLKATMGTFLVSVLTPLIQRLNIFIQIITKAVNKLKEFLPLLGIKIQKATSTGSGASSGLENLTDDLYDVGDAAEDAAKKAAKLTDGPFSEMHKVGGDDSTITSKMNEIFGDGGLLDYENPYKFKTLKAVDTWLDNLMSKLDFGELKIAGLEVLEDILHWIKAIKKAWKDAFNTNNKGVTWLQSIIDLATSLLQLVDSISDAFLKMFESGWGKTIFEEMLETATKLNQTVKQIVDRFKAFWNSGSGHYGTVMTEQGDINSHKLTPKELAEGKRSTDMFNTPDGFRTHTGGGGQQLLASQSEFRELTWGEYLAQQFYKVVVAIENLKQALLDFIQWINENINWEDIFKGWGNFLEDITNSLNDLSDWLKSHPEVAANIGKIITAIAANPEKVINTVIAFKLLSGVLAGLPKIIVGALILSKAGILSALAGIAGKIVGFITGIPGLINTALTKIGSFAAFFFEEGGILGGLFDISIVIAAFVEMTAIIRNTFANWDEIVEHWKKDGGFFHGWFVDPDYWLVELPNKLRGPVATFIGNLGADIIQGLIDVGASIIEHISGFVNTVTETIVSFVSNMISEISKLISKLKELIGIQNKVKPSSSFSGSSGAKWVNNSSPAGYASIKFSGKHANGGVWAPNSPAIAVLGDQPRSRGNEYALTEQHLDNIADKMASGIINGFARVSLAGNGGSGTPNIYVQIGDREIKDLIVSTVNEENYRRF